MAKYPEALDHMLAAWNEADATKAQAHLLSALSDNVRFVDPSIDVTGIDGFEANLKEVKSKIPGANYSRTSGVDSQHEFYRYHWAIHQEGELLLTGFDVTEIDEHGKIACVMGFFGDIPEA